MSELESANLPMNPSNTKTLFDADYFERGSELGLSCYTNYRWLPDLTIPMCVALEKALGFEKNDKILDFGCAKGYVVKALRHLGYDVQGCDISEYAIASADEETRPYLSLFEVSEMVPGYDWILAKDVLEHMDEAECLTTLREIRGATANLFVAVPLGDGHKYTIPEMEKDVTHKIRQPLWWWSGLMEEAGFKVKSATFSMPGVKENWTRKYPFGNGFLICT